MCVDPLGVLIVSLQQAVTMLDFCCAGAKSAAVPYNFLGTLSPGLVLGRLMRLFQTVPRSEKVVVIHAVVVVVRWRDQMVALVVTLICGLHGVVIVFDAIRKCLAVNIYDWAVIIS